MKKLVFHTRGFKGRMETIAWIRKADTGLEARNWKGVPDDQLRFTAVKTENLGGEVTFAVMGLNLTPSTFPLQEV